MFYWPTRGTRKLRRSKERHPHPQVVKCHARWDGFLARESHIWIDGAVERKENTPEQVGVQVETPNILVVENMVESEVLYMTEEATIWLLNLGVSYHVTSHRSQFRQYTTRNFNVVWVSNSQHYVIVWMSTVELNLWGGSTLVLCYVRHILDVEFDMWKNM